MEFIKAAKLVFDYITKDEEEKVESVNRAIDHLDLNIEQGSFVAILGHNGSGKSTFAKLLNLILEPTSGTLIVDGVDISKGDLSEDAVRAAVTDAGYDYLGMQEQ